MTLLRIGFSCSRTFPPGRWALTPPFHVSLRFAAGRSGLCGTFRKPEFSSGLPRLTHGILSCGARTFLSTPFSGLRQPDLLSSDKNTIKAYNHRNVFFSGLTYGAKWILYFEIFTEYGLPVSSRSWQVSAISFTFYSGYSVL